MKRITALLLAVALTLGSVGAAQADGIDIKVKGQWDFSFGWVNNKVFKDSAHNDDRYRTPGGRDDDNFEARQRIRTQINFITSEYLQAVLMFEIGGIDWGRAEGNVGRSSGGALDTDGVNIETKRAYLDWIIPNTEVSVRMGLQGLTLPSTRLGSIVFDADVAGIVVNSPVTDWLGLTAFWIRPFDQYRNDAGAFRGDGNDHLSDETDIFGLVAPLDFDGVAFTPWFMYGFIGGNSGMMEYLFAGEGVNSNREEHSSARAWWLGGNFELTMFDPLTFSLDAIYGRMNRLHHSGFTLDANGNIDDEWSDNLSAAGWYIGATLDYKLDWGTPGIFGWYASGDDANADDTGRIGRLPVVGTDGGFTATSFGSYGYFGVGNGGDSTAVLGTGTGTWGIGVQIADVSFIEDLSHTLRFAYYRGTNDSDLLKKGGVAAPYASDALYLTDEDSVYEINFDHNYKIYENLEACLELGWLHLKTDKDTWGNRNLDESDDAWKAEINFRYSF